MSLIQIIAAMKKGFLLSTTLLLAAALFAQNPVKTTNGMLTGVTEKSGVQSYKGIPYAAPPVGDLRWKAPQPAANWEGQRKADHFGPRAMQPPIFGDMNFRSDGMGEDCLYLNVWVPPGQKKQKAAARISILLWRWLCCR